MQVIRGDAAVSGDDDSRFQELYRKYYRAVVGFFVGQGFSREKARDLAQDTFVRVYRSMETYRGEAAWGFLETTARRLALNEIRSRATLMRKARETSLDEPLQQIQSMAQDPWTGALPQSPETELIKREEDVRRRRRLQEAIENLPQSLRTCVLLWLQDCSYREIMKDLGLSLDAVKSRLNEARHRLREQLGDEPGGIELPEGPVEDDQ